MNSGGDALFVFVVLLKTPRVGEARGVEYGDLNAIQAFESIDLGVVGLAVLLRSTALVGHVVRFQVVIVW